MQEMPSLGTELLYHYGVHVAMTPKSVSNVSIYNKIIVGKLRKRKNVN